MIVSHREANRIFAGRKTQHRLPRSRRAPAPDRVVPITYRQPNPGLGYDRSGRPKLEPVRACYVRILERWPTTLLAATEEEVEAEGFKHFREMMDAWGNPESDVAVWAIRFELDQRHHPRLLAATITAGRQGAYTETPARALPDEPEAVDEFTQARITKDANDRDAKRRSRRWELIADLPFDTQLELVKTEARHRHVDIRDELRAIERWRDPTAKERQLARIKQKLAPQVFLAA